MRRAGGSRGPAEDTTPHLRPVERIELSEKHKTLRLILTVVFLAIGITALTVAALRYFSVGTGWRTVDVNQIPPMGSSSELELQYDISGGGARFISRTQYPVGSEVMFRFSLFVSGKMNEYSLHGRVLFSQPMKNNPGAFEHRMQFIHIPRDDRESIIRYIFEEERKIRRREKG